MDCGYGEDAQAEEREVVPAQKANVHVPLVPTAHDCDHLAKKGKLRRKAVEVI